MTFTFTAVAIVLGASLLWGCLDLLRKLLVEKVSSLSLLFFMTMGMLPLFGIWAVLNGDYSVHPTYVGPAFGSVVLNIAANLAFFESVKLSPLSKTIPLLSFTPVFTALLGIPFLGELPSAQQGLGIVLVVAGAFLLNIGRDLSPLAVLRAFVSEKGSVLMLFVALMWSIAIALDKLAVERSNEPLHAFVLSLGIGLAMFLLMAIKGRLAELKEAKAAPWTLLAAVVVGAVALGLQLAAFKFAWISVVETFKLGVGNTMAVILGRVVFGEPITVGKVASVSTMAAGVALVLI